MRNSVNTSPHTRAQCLDASTHFPLTRIYSRDGERAWDVYSSSVVKGGKRSSISSSDRVLLGALYLAAGSNRSQVNTALARACALTWPYDGDAVFSAVVYDLALSMLRNGWRKGADEDSNFAAEMNAQSFPDCALPL